ncbi:MULTISPECIES: DMT family transporter [unclassified Frankia]|uniref:DMT family transporter n=1 Tax=unclassified Frankia TaxID=2632575 RepID=UPI001EE413B2|nr:MULTISPECIES: DMT family transporter [unclassified Frankia]
MRSLDSATARWWVSGRVLGGAGVLAFSMSLPATRVAVEDLNPWFVAFARAVGAGLLASGYLRLTGSPRPTRDQWRQLAAVALGVVFGFPLLTSLALTSQTAAHAAVVIAVLPACTAVFAVLRGRERPPPLFWAAALAGLVAVLAFLVASGAVSGGLGPADLALLGAVGLCGLGYAEGGRLARELGGARTICWALVGSLPLTVPATVVVTILDPPRAGPASWLGFAYVTVVSMFLGFFAWYAGLARGGVARTGQLQLAQPVLTLAWSALLLREHVSPAALAVSGLVLACVALTQYTRSGDARRNVNGAIGAQRQWERQCDRVGDLSNARKQ